MTQFRYGYIDCAADTQDRTNSSSAAIPDMLSRPCFAGFPVPGIL